MLTKILVVTQNLPPAICGVGDYTINFTNELIRQLPNLEVAFLFNPKTMPPTENLLTKPYQLYGVAPLHWRVKDLPRLLQVARQSQAHLVHIHYVPHLYYRGGIGVTLSLFALILRLTGKRIIVTGHEFYIDWAKQPKIFLQSLIQRLSFLILLIASNDFVVTTGLRAKILRQWLHFQPKSKFRIAVAPVGSNFRKRASTFEEQEKLKTQYGLPSKGLILTNLGTMRWSLQLDWLLSALEVAKTVQPGSCLLLLGCPPLVELKGRPDVVCTGYCTTEQVNQLLQTTDIYLLPLEDGVSGRRTALMAGLHYGLPIVTTTGHNTEPDFVKNLPVLCASVLDKAGFVTQVKELATNEAQRSELGQQAKYYYNEHFSWQTIVAQQLSLFNIKPKPINILYVNGAAELGGGEIVLRNIVLGLNPSQYRAVVVFLSSGTLVQELRASGIRVYVFEAGHFRQLWRTLWVILQLTRVILYERINLVQSAGAKIQLYGGLAALVCGKPSVLVMQDNVEVASQWERLARWLPTAQIVANSASTLEKVKQFLPNRVTKVIYPGINQLRFGPAVSTGSARAKLGLQSAQIAIGVFARLQRWKGLSVFIEAAYLVAKVVPHARFFIVGGTMFGLEVEYATELQIQIDQLGLGEHVHLLGARPADEIPDLMRAMDIVASTSVLPEGFGQTLVEAMLCVRPVVATAIGGPVEIIKDGESGLLVPPHDAQALADAFLRLIHDPEFAQKLAEAGQLRATKKFGLDTMLADFQDLYQSLIAKK